MVLGAWTGWHEVAVHRKVLGGLDPGPVHYDITHEHGVFNVAVSRTPPGEDTFVRLFQVPNPSDIPKHLIAGKDTRVEFLLACGRVVVISGTVALERLPWLKGRIGGEEGYRRVPRISLHLDCGKGCRQKRGPLSRPPHFC